MATIQFENGAKVNFEGTPTQKDVEEVAKKLGLSGSQAKKGNALGKAGNILGSIFGGNKIGEFIGTQDFKAGSKDELQLDPTLAARLKGSKSTKAQQLLSEAPGAFSNVRKGPSAGQVIGDIGQVGLTLATLGAGTGAKVGAQAGLKAFGKTVGKEALLGAGFGTTGALKAGDTSVGELAKGALGGAALGGAIGVAGKGLSKAADLITIKSPKQLISSGVLRLPSKQAGRGIEEAFMKRKLGGKSLSAIETITQKEVSDTGKAIDAALRETKGGVKPREFLKDTIREWNRTRGTNVSTDQLKKRLQKFSPDFAKILDKDFITWKQFNRLRDAIDENLRPETFLGKQLSNELKLIKRFADRSRNYIKGNTGTGPLFKQQSEALSIRNMAKQAAQKFETQGRPGLLDVGSAGIGLLGGGPVGALGAVAAQRTARNPRVLGGLARALSILGRGRQAVRPITKAGKRIGKLGLFKALSEAQ